MSGVNKERKNTVNYNEKFIPPSKDTDYILRKANSSVENIQERTVIGWPIPDGLPGPMEKPLQKRCGNCGVVVPIDSVRCWNCNAGSIVEEKASEVQVFEQRNKPDPRQADRISSKCLYLVGMSCSLGNDLDCDNCLDFEVE